MTVYRSMVVKHLQTNGPSTGVELPRKSKSPSITPNERNSGVRGFNPSIANASGTTTSRVGNTTTVYYLRKEHAPEAVIREWVKVNPKVLEASPRAFLQAVNGVGSEFAEVSKEVARDLYGEARWQDAFGNLGGGNEPGKDSHETRNRLLDMDASEVFGGDGG